MGFGFWGAFAAPFLAQAAPTGIEAAAPATPTAIVEPAGDDFFGAAPMAGDEMAEAAGGAASATDIGQLGVNTAEQTGRVAGVAVDGATGEIASNSVANNSGFTTVFNNTGNGVIFQNTVNVNIFLGSPSTSN